MTPQQLTGRDSSHLAPLLIGKKSFLVNSDVKQDLLQLKLAAEDKGFRFHIASGFRSFDNQLSIWNRKLSGTVAIHNADNTPLDISSLNEEEKVRAILNWSALPGASRHHWGTDFDVYDAAALPKDQSLLLEPWEYQSGHQAEFSQWLTRHAEQFGFFFPYDQYRGGVAYEPWHISHLKSSKCNLAQLSLNILFQQLNKSEIMARETVLTLLEEIYNNYVTNINPIGRM